MEFFYRSVDICDLNLAIDKCSRADSLFYKNHGSRILVNLSESLDLNNVTRENIEVRIRSFQKIRPVFTNDVNLFVF